MKTIVNETLKQLLSDAFNAGNLLGYFGEDNKDILKESHGYSNFEEWFNIYIKDNTNED